MSRVVATSLALSALLLFGSAPVHARTVYDVEIIVFENVDAPADQRERWRPDVVIPRFDRTAEFANGNHALETARLEPDDTSEDAALAASTDEGTPSDRAPIGAAMLMDPPDGFARLGDDELRLIDQRNRLIRSDRYRVLRHMGWQQPALEPDEALSLRVRAGEPRKVRMPVSDVGRLAQPVRIEEILATAARPGSAADAEEMMPSTEDPGTADPGTADPGTADPGTADPGTADPGTADPGTADPGTADSGMHQAMGPASDLSAAEREFLQRAGVLPRMREVSVYPLDGTVRIEVRRYLHVHTDLYFTVPVEWSDAPVQSVDKESSPGGSANGGNEAGTAVAGTALNREVATGPDGQPVLSYPFRQHRRMRSREVHYIDHPVISMLIVVTPRERDDS